MFSQCRSCIVPKTQHIILEFNWGDYTELWLGVFVHKANKKNGRGLGKSGIIIGKVNVNAGV